MLYHALRAAAHVALRWYYADVVVQGGERVPVNGPLLIVANHPNALVDALLVSTSLRRRVMLTAKATLFEHPLLAPVLRAVGVVPLRRATDERDAAQHNPDGTIPVSRNLDAFQQVREALAAESAVLVFPEGISHDQPALAPLRTGAARMALDAAAGGIRGLKLLPLGLVFERKEQPRSRVLVRAGVPIDMDEWLSAHPAGDATQLTTTLDRALRAVTLNFASDERATRAVSLARALAAITEMPGSVSQPRRLATEAHIAERIERATEAVSQASPGLAVQADEFTARVAALESRLAEHGATLAEVQISPRLHHGAQFVLREGLVVVLALPVALLGRVMHWLPLKFARALAMRPLATDPSRDLPAMRTIVLGLATVLAWYALQLLIVGHWVGIPMALAWIVVIFLAARVDFLFGDRVRRARVRARTYLALRRAPELREYALAEVQTLGAEAVALERALVGSAP